MDLVLGFIYISSFLMPTETRRNNENRLRILYVFEKIYDSIWSAAVQAKLLCKDNVFEWSGKPDCSYCQDQCFSWRRINVRFVVFDIRIIECVIYTILVFFSFFWLGGCLGMKILFSLTWIAVFFISQCCNRYDYLFDPDERDELKVPCRCKAPNCRKFMN